MSIAVFGAVLAAALLHAIWNALIKSGGDKRAVMLTLNIGTGLIGLGVATTRPLPGLEIWPWLIASGIIRTAYQLFLTYAYEQGDLSRVYPIARGAAPLIVLAVGGLVLNDVIAVPELAGILVLGAGILLMARGAFSNGESRQLVWFALGSAVATAGYSLVDGAGSRLSGDPVSYVSWALVVTSAIYTPLVLMQRGRSLLGAAGSVWRIGAVASGASFLAYAIVVWAFTQAPIALVTALRETSILFAVIIGVLFLGERLDRGKAVAAFLIVGGVVLTRL